MSEKGEREVSEKEIQDKLDEIINNILAPKEVRLLAKLVFNLRFDLDELKIELLKVITGEEDIGDVNHKPEEEDGRFYT